MSPSRSPAALAALALEVAVEAGALALTGYRHPKRVAHKGAIDLVTEFDTRVEELIRARLAQATPDIALVAEEGGGDAGAALTWYVDPIDGTTNYAHGHPFWCVAIGLARADGSPVAGAVVAPALATHWTGAEGHPAERSGEPCRVSEVDRLDQALLATGFPYDRHTSAANNFAAFVAAKKRAQGVRRCGSAALDLCLVADGTYDGYWERKLKPWDVMAGAAIAAAAGARLTSLGGSAPRPLTGELVATNGRVHDELLELLRAAG